MSATDHQVAGDHYKKLKIQPIEYILANEMQFCEGAIIKYISRWRDKGGVEDLRKIKPVSYTHLTLPTIYSV